MFRNSDEKQLLAVHRDLEANRRQIVSSYPAVLYPALWASQKQGNLSSLLPTNPLSLTSHSDSVASVDNSSSLTQQSATVDKDSPSELQPEELTASASCAVQTIPIEAVLHALHALRSLLITAEEERDYFRTRLKAAEEKAARASEAIAAAQAAERARHREFVAQLEGELRELPLQRTMAREATVVAEVVIYTAYEVFAHARASGIFLR